MKGNFVQHHRALPAGHRADSCEQLLGVKGLGEIVVRPGVQPRDLVGNGRAGGEHQHGGLHALASHLPQYTEPVEFWQHDVQQDKVIRADADIVQRGLAVRHPVCAVSRLAENVRNRLRQGGFVFYNENIQRNPSFSSSFYHCTQDSERVLKKVYIRFSAFFQKRMDNGGQRKEKEAARWNPIRPYSNGRK